MEESFVVMRGQDDYFDVELGGLRGPGNRETVTLRHGEIEPSHVGPELSKLSDSLVAVFGLGNHEQSWITRDHLRQSFAKDRMIIGDQNANLTTLPLCHLSQILS